MANEQPNEQTSWFDRWVMPFAPILRVLLLFALAAFAALVAKVGDCVRSP